MHALFKESAQEVEPCETNLTNLTAQADYVRSNKKGYDELKKKHVPKKEKPSEPQYVSSNTPQMARLSRVNEAQRQKKVLRKIRKISNLDAAVDKRKLDKRQIKPTVKTKPRQQKATVVGM